MTPKEIEAKIQEIEEKHKKEDFLWKDYSSFAISIGDNKETLLKLIKCEPKFYYHGSDRLRIDKDICSEALKNTGYLLEYMPKTIQEDEELVKIAIKNFPLAFRYTGYNIGDNEEIVKLTFETFIKDGNPNELMLKVSDRLKNDLSFMKEIISISPYCFTGAGDKVRDNNELFLMAYNSSDSKNYILEFSSIRIKVLCMNKDPVATILADSLSKELNENTIKVSRPKKI